MTIAYDADKDQDFLIYLAKAGLAGQKPGDPNYEAAMIRWQREKHTRESKKNDRQRAAKQQPQERNGALRRHPLY